MKFTNFKQVSAAVVLTAAATSVSAAGFGVTGITGDWVNPTPSNVSNLVTTNVAGNGTDTISWGNGNINSSYSFTPETAINPVPLNSAFALGDFVHNNYPISGFALKTVDYAIAFATNSVPSTLNAILQFKHNETENSGSVNNCQFTSVTPCADNVSVTLGTGATGTNFTEGGVNYFFELLGFSTDSGATYDTSYITQENSINEATLYGKVTEVPAPAGLLLLGVAIAGLRFSSKRKVK